MQQCTKPVLLRPRKKISFGLKRSKTLNNTSQSYNNKSYGHHIPSQHALGARRKHDAY